MKTQGKLLGVLFLSLTLMGIALLVENSFVFQALAYYLSLLVPFLDMGAVSLGSTALCIVTAGGFYAGICLVLVRRMNPLTRRVAVLSLCGYSVVYYALYYIFFVFTGSQSQPLFQLVYVAEWPVAVFSYLRELLFLPFYTLLPGSATETVAFHVLTLVQCALPCTFFLFPQRRHEARKGIPVIRS